MQHKLRDLTPIRGSWDGTLQSATTTWLQDLLSPSYLAARDFNHDGKSDLALASGTGIYVLLGNGEGTFSLFPTPIAQNPYVGRYGYGDRSVAVADLNNESKLGLLGLESIDPPKLPDGGAGPAG